jgi:predicted dehydrogenase
LTNSSTVFDLVQHTVGDIQIPQSHLQLQRPHLEVQDTYTGRFIETVKSDVPDLIYVTGSLPGSEHVIKDATLHIRFRPAQSFSGEPALVWTIIGEKGEIRLTSTLSTMLQISSLADVAIDIDEHENDEIHRVEWKWNSYPELPYLARSYGSLYEAYASGAVGEYADFEHAFKRHTQLDEILESWDASKAR